VALFNAHQPGCILEMDGEYIHFLIWVGVRLDTLVPDTVIAHPG
jgi:hypothetical protein